MKRKQLLIILVIINLLLLDVYVNAMQAEKDEGTRVIYLFIFKKSQST